MSGHPLGPLAAGVPEAVVTRLAAARAVLALGHESPDADSLGAALAIACIVERRGGRATVVASDEVPALYRFLPGVERVRADPEPDLAYDLVVLCDCGDVSRVGPVRERNRALFDAAAVLTIDHHSSNAGFGDVAWIDPAAAATCEMIALLTARLDVPLDAADGALAFLLAAGIVMDTATFAHPNVTPRWWRRALPSPRSAAGSTAASQTSSWRSSGGSSAASSATLRGSSWRPPWTMPIWPRRAPGPSTPKGSSTSWLSRRRPRPRSC
jgi:nanoRNase/pAp phosphatase (c-di-AMP/oligoRNAs hydrolase)